MQTLSNLRRALLAAATVTLACTAQAQVTYAVTPLGDFHPTGLNDNAWVSGYQDAALLWRPGAGLSSLGSLGCDTAGCVNFLRATGVNNAGQVTGYSGRDPDHPNGFAARAFLWDEANGMRDLGDLPGGSEYSYGNAINASGTVAGRGSSTFGAVGKEYATVFGEGQVPQNLGALAASEQSRANGINDSGHVVGYGTRPGGFEAFIWTPVDGMVGLGDFDGGRVYSFANAINNEGWVVGEGEITLGAPRAFLWREADGLIDLGLLPGRTSSQAKGLNELGQIVGASGGLGFLWSEAAGMQALNDLLDPALGAGWNVIDAVGINESGQILARAGSSVHGFNAVLLTPVPEPGTALTLLLGLTAVGLMKLRTRP